MPPNYEKNTHKIKVPKSLGMPLPEDTVLVSISIYHPISKNKTQEFLFTLNKTLNDLHSSIHCLSNFCTFSTLPSPIFFKFGEIIYKSLETPFSEISLKTGEVCTYSHRGICQHNIIVTDVRLINFKDPTDEIFYPFQTFAAKSKRKICEVCEIVHAKFISIRDQNLGLPYVYLCEYCIERIKNPHSEIYPYLHE